MTLRLSRTYGDRMSQLEADRIVKHRLAVLHHAEEVTGNVAMTCRYYGMTRQAFFTWRRRHQEPHLTLDKCGQGRIMKGKAHDPA